MLLCEKIQETVVHKEYSCRARAVSFFRGSGKSDVTKPIRSVDVVTQHLHSFSGFLITTLLYVRTVRTSEELADGLRHY
jgi:hypothetical protein